MSEWNSVRLQIAESYERGWAQGFKDGNRAYLFVGILVGVLIGLALISLKGI